ncbi:MarR family winged helix-turn-helix transcriptional regulator [Alkaliphilus serpentinus]|uniref:MarR family transcriptional regulator n=1 Tax=Alkaliphilus serpentinus TaxID=1482731 RepID=A0A833M5U8_9FIRM|nr:MarR family transcriptional regulator [Alkaliphilus serpentinus]KAB3524965.1 MarR family transcriptional regulator [Alkaliphilus serpentinus]
MNPNNIGRHISYIYRAGQSYISKELEAYGVGSGQYTILLVLYKKDGISQEDLANHIRMDKANIGRGIKKLMEHGLIIRKTNPNDQRAYCVYLTDKGWEIQPKVYEVLTNWLRVLVKGFNEEEIQMSQELLQRMFQNLCDFEK